MQAIYLSRCFSVSSSGLYCTVSVNKRPKGSSWCVLAQGAAAGLDQPVLVPLLGRAGQCRWKSRFKSIQRFVGLSALKYNESRLLLKHYIGCLIGERKVNSFLSSPQFSRQD